MESFNQNVIKHKTGLLNLAAELGNISKACRIMGFSRDTFYRYQTARDAGGVEALFEVSRKKPNLKNRVDEATEQAVIDFAIAFPAYGQVRASNELRKEEVFVSPSGVRSIWLRHDLASMKQRLRALERKSAEEGIVLTEAQVQALERKKHDDKAFGELETHHPGLSRESGHILRRYHQGSRTHLPANLCGYLLKVGSRQALCHQNAHYRSRPA